MYAAYHSGQFASRCPLLFSCWPWAAAARRIALARSLADAKVVVAGSMRPGARCVTSCTNPRVAIGIFEGDVGAVTLALGIGAADAPRRQKWRAVEHFTRLDAPGHEILVGGFNVGDDQPAPE
jgi:hypothetical protein